MATTPKNRIVRQVRPGSLFESALNVISTAVSWNQGDLIYLDTATKLLKPVTSDANCATFQGIAIQTIVSGVAVGPYAGLGTTQAVSDISGPKYGVIANLKLKSGDVFLTGQDVYGSAVDAQTVSASGTNSIGKFQDAGLTAGSSSTGNVLLGAVAALDF
jgi:hypothetical protein